jgi:signal transduction histidine kinase
VLASSVNSLVRRVITDEVARAALGRMYEAAAETIDAREQVLKIVSHDLRNPLNTISMTATMMLEVPGTPEQQRENLLRVKRAGERMNRLIQDLLDVAKLEAGRVAIDAKPIEVAPLLREAHDMLAPIAAERAIQLEATAAEGLPMVTADSGRILQVLSNLAGNAIKFTPKNGRIFLRADRDPRGVRFSIRDSGPGIPPEQLSQIFGRFWQANPADRRGIGLGLTIAKGIVEAHGGRIWCESRLGEGTTFQFTLGEELPPTSSGGHERRRDGSSA